jgi:hypothetical protein
MNSRRSIVVVEDFYEDAPAVRDYSLRQSYYLPYEEDEEVEAGRRWATWWATRFKSFEECPFKSSETLMEALEDAVGERIDMDRWRAPFPIDARSYKPLGNQQDGFRSCLWNCSFHVKPENRQKPGDGIHNHVVDSWNSVGPDGWAGIIYLAPAAPLDGGLFLWRNLNPEKQFDWMTAANNWRMVDRFGNVFNRLLLVRGDIPHSGAGGWGDCLETGRMYQTFFFHTVARKTLWPVCVPDLRGRNGSSCGHSS